jgi:hypothetical protein
MIKTAELKGRALSYALADAPHDAQFMWDGRFYKEDVYSVLYMFDGNKSWIRSAIGSKHRLLSQALMINHGKPTILFKPK